MDRSTEVRAAGLFRRPAGREGGVPRKRFRVRAAVAPVVLAAYTLVAAIGAVLALAPSALARGPRGLRRTPRGAALDLAPTLLDRVEPAARPAATAAEEHEALGG